MFLIEIKTSKAQIIYVSTSVMINSPRLVLINSGCSLMRKDKFNNFIVD